ncbi:MAG: hypothetical protein LBJ95_02215 [Oscillospiraceae bacterium]|nr:hypothetical protein [Oscillospiraceae bacterium]
MPSSSSGSSGSPNTPLASCMSSTATEFKRYSLNTVTHHRLSGPTSAPLSLHVASPFLKATNSMPRLFPSGGLPSTESEGTPVPAKLAAKTSDINFLAVNFIKFTSFRYKI